MLHEPIVNEFVEKSELYVDNINEIIADLQCEGCVFPNNFKCSEMCRVAILYDLNENIIKLTKGE